MENILVFGHQKPDSDSVCSAIAYADLKKQLGNNVESRRLGKLSKETEFILKEFHFDAPELLKEVTEGQNIILVDHNEAGQSVKNREKATILEVIDHHRVSDFKTDIPLTMRVEPVGCTSTIIYKLYKENNLEIPKNIAGIMVSAIISDTLTFTSPTCTEQDRVAGEDLAKIAGIEINEYADRMFEAGTSLEGMTAEEILLTDCKMFNVGENKLFVAQVNTLNLKSVENMTQEFLTEMNNYCQKNGAVAFILAITDIKAGGSMIYTIGEKSNLVKSTFGIKENEDAKYLPGVVSRKKQLVPQLTEAFS